jgi:hypothetical protein
MAEALTLQIVVDDKGTPVLKQFAGSVQGAADALHKHGSAASARMTQETSKLTSGLGLLKTAVVAVGAAVAAVGLGKLAADVVGTASRMDSLQRAMVAAAGGADKGAKAMEFVRSESQRLGLELEGTAGAYKNLLAATVATGKSASDAQLIFSAVAEASTAMGLSAEESQGALTAVAQIMSKGTIQAEELTGQLRPWACPRNGSWT